jgi:hypothetical protein
MRSIASAITNHPDLLFAIIRNTQPNLALARTGPVFVSGFPTCRKPSVAARADQADVRFNPINP